MVQDDLEPGVVRGGDKILEVLIGDEVRVHFKEVLDPVAVVVIHGLPLPQHRADPKVGDPESLQVTELGGDPFEGAAGRWASADSHAVMSSGVATALRASARENSCVAPGTVLSARSL